MFVNKDRFHTEWLEEMADFAWKHLRNKAALPSLAGGLFKTREEAEAVLAARKKEAQDQMKSVGTIWKFREDNDFVLEKHGDFDLPPDSAKTVQNMARFCQCSMSRCDSIEGWAGEKIPKPMFCLHSLLQAAFPKDVDSGFFKANDCAIAPEGTDDVRADYVAFGGLGVILMNTCRQLFGPLLTDAEILRKAGQSSQNTDGYFISIVD